MKAPIELHYGKCRMMDPMFWRLKATAGILEVLFVILVQHPDNNQMIWQKKKKSGMWLFQACNKPVQSFNSAQTKWVDGLSACLVTYLPTSEHSARALIAHIGSLAKAISDLMKDRESVAKIPQIPWQH